MSKKKIISRILGGCLQESKYCLYGKYKGFYITIEPLNASNDYQYIVKINAYSSYDENNVKLNSFLQKQVSLSKKLKNAAAYERYLVMNLKAPFLARSLPDLLNSHIIPVVDYLCNNQYISGCEYCGTTESTLNCYEINASPYYICDSCKNEVQTALQANKDAITSQKSNLLSGLVGAFLGSLIGCVLWVIIYRFGYIAGISGLVTGICAMKGYELLGGKLDKKGVICSVIIMAISIYFANRISWTWAAYDALKDYGYLFSDAYRYLYEILADSELLKEFFTDLIIGYILTAMACSRNILNALTISTGNYTINKTK